MKRLFDVLARDGRLIVIAGAVFGVLFVAAPRGCAAVLKLATEVLWLG